MAMVKPIGQTKNAFDANNDEIFYFTSTGGNQVVKNRLVIRRQYDNLIVYDNTEVTYQTKQTVPKETLDNGEYYNYYFVAYDINNNASEPSDSISFYCYTTPVLSFTNIPSDRTLRTSNYNFTLNYYQPEGELLDFIIIKLYDATNKLIKTSDELYYVGSDNFNYEFNGFEDKTTYYIEASGETVNGTLFSADRLQINIAYEMPVSPIDLEVSSNCNDGYVRVRSELIFADGESFPSAPEYIGTKGIDVSHNLDKIQWTQGYSVPSDFILTLWGEHSQFGEVCRLWNEGRTYASISIIKRLNESDEPESFCMLEVYNGNILLLRQYSNIVVPMNSTTKYMLWIKKVGEDWDIVLTILEHSATHLAWNDNEHNNVKYNKRTDIVWVGEDDTTPYIPMNPYSIGNTSTLFPILNTAVMNGVYYHLDITKDTDKPFSTSYPTWDYNTILDCDFQRNISGGNSVIVLSQLDKLKFKRREKGTFDWVTIREISVRNVKDASLIINDSFVPSGVIQEYALVPLAYDGSEGNYVIKEVQPYLMEYLFLH